MSQVPASKDSALTGDAASKSSQITDQNVDNVPLTRKDSTAEPTYPSTSKALVIISGLWLTGTLISLDRLIVGVAVPSITNEFHSLGDTGWYASAYLLTFCAFMLMAGRVYTLYNPKWVFLCAMIVFEVGSAICGSAPNSTAFIVGRAIAGFGCAFLFQGSVIIIIYIFPLHKRPQYMGISGMIYGLTSAVAPLIGGALTDGPGWRWCFYINLPIGAATFAVLVFFLDIPTEMLRPRPKTAKELFERCDPLGTLVFLPSIACLVLALQWGGVTYPWSSARVIVLLVLFAVLLLAFIGIQAWKKENATVPPHIFLQRSILAGTWFAFFNSAALQCLIYFLPIWFQAIKGASAVKSGVMSLPLVIGLVISSVTAGILTRRIGYYAPWMILSSILTPIGTGLISTFTPSTEHPAWIGYQALYGIGLGLGMQQPSIAAQTVLARKDVPIGAAMAQFSQTLGGAIFVSVANNLFGTKLASELSKIPGLNIDGSVAEAGATELRDMVPADLLPEVLVVYNDAVRMTFYIATALACMTVFGAAAMQWKSVKKDKPKKSSDAEKEGGKQETV